MRRETFLTIAATVAALTPVIVGLVLWAMVVGYETGAGDMCADLRRQAPPGYVTCQKDILR